MRKASRGGTVHDGPPSLDGLDAPDTCKVPERQVMSLRFPMPIAVWSYRRFPVRDHPRRPLPTIPIRPRKVSVGHIPGRASIRPPSSFSRRSSQRSGCSCCVRGRATSSAGLLHQRVAGGEVQGRRRPPRPIRSDPSRAFAVPRRPVHVMGYNTGNGTSFGDTSSLCRSVNGRASRPACRMRSPRRLAHQVGSAIERSHARSDLFDKRRGLMDRWAEYLTK